MNHLNDLLLRKLSISEEYQNALDYRSQSHALYNLLHENGFSNHKLASLLGVDHKTLKNN